MKGAVFVALAQMVEQEQGLSCWHRVLDAAEEDGVYTATMNYDDERLYTLVVALCNELGMELADALRHFGEFLFGVLHQSAPEFAAKNPNFFDYIASIGGVIHLEVHKLDESARPPHMEVIERRPGAMDLKYVSDRKLCFLAEGLLAGAAALFYTEIDVEQPTCMHTGADHCVLRITERG